MSTVKSKKLQVGTDATSSNNFTIYQPSTPDGTLRIGIGNADSPTEVGRFDNKGYKPDSSILPTFAANASGLSLSAATYTKIVYGTEEWDTTGDYDHTTGRFTPSVAGYYQLSAKIHFSTNTSGAHNISIYKNGVSHRFGIDGTFSLWGMSMSTLVYANGTTDYFEVYAYTQTAKSIYSSGSVWSWFTGNLIQRA